MPTSHLYALCDFCFLLPCVGCPGCPRGAAAEPSRAGRGGGGGGGRAAPLPAAPRAAGSRGRLSRGRLSRARLASAAPLPPLPAASPAEAPPPPPPSSPHSKCARSRGSGLASPPLRRPNRPRCRAGTSPGAEGGQGRAGRAEVPATGGLGLALEHRREKCWWKGLRSCAARGGRARLVRGLGSQTPPVSEVCACREVYVSSVTSRVH